MREALLNTPVSQTRDDSVTGPSVGRMRNAVMGAFIAGAIAFLGGCSSDSDQPYEERPVEQIYNKAMDYMADGNYQRAAQEFDEVERQHPYSIWARRATLMSAYAHYKVNEYDDAILTAQRYISLHPGSKEVAYAYYLVALSYYEQISDVGRDQKMTEDALASLTTLIQRFPRSEYARDARLKLDLTLDHLAGKEMEIGRFYERSGKWISAQLRFQNVVENYQTTSHAPEALYRLTETSLSLGLKEEAVKYAAVLGANYPGTEWYEKAYELVGDNAAGVTAS